MIGAGKKNNMYDKALEFGKNIVLLYRELEKKNIERELLKQLLRSGTSVGANIAEAQGSISENDYVAKIHIAYKELIETRFWLELLFEIKDLNEIKFKEINDLYNELAGILYTIIKNIHSKNSKF